MNFHRMRILTFANEVISVIVKQFSNFLRLSEAKATILKENIKQPTSRKQASFGS